MSHAQKALELVYELRSSAMDEIAEKMSTALGDVGSEKATASIALQMQKLLAADVLYESVVAAGNQRRPRLQRDRGRRRAEERLPAGRDQVARRNRGQLRARHRSAARPAATTGGVHGLGLIGTSINGTELTRRIDHLGEQRRHAGSRSAGAEPGRIDRERGLRLGHRQRRKHAERHDQQHRGGETETALIPLTPAPTRRSDDRSRRRHGAAASRSPKTTRPATTSPSNRGS